VLLFPMYRENRWEGKGRETARNALRVMIGIRIVLCCDGMQPLPPTPLSLSQIFPRGSSPVPSRH
jgi:hypothetical protein